MSAKSLIFILMILLVTSGLTEKTISAPLKTITQQEEKLKQAEEAADRFIQRWHETLDLNVLFDELYIANAEQRRYNISLYCGVYAFLTGTSPDCFKVRNNLSEETMREGFFAFWNMAYLQDEYHLLFQNDEKVSDPPEIQKLKQQQEEKEERTEEWVDKNILLYVKEQIELANTASAAYRRHLTSEAFQSSVYRENLQQKSEPAKVVEGFSDWNLKGKDIYKVIRGPFEIYFVEEDGQFKVLTLGFEL